MKICCKWQQVNLPTDRSRWITRKFDHTSSGSALLHQLYLEPPGGTQKNQSPHLPVQSPSWACGGVTRPPRSDTCRQTGPRNCDEKNWRSFAVPRPIVPKIICSENYHPMEHSSFCWGNAIRIPDSITSAASVSAFRSQPSSVTHLVAVISLWRLVTTFQIQIQTERENSEIADRQTDRETDYTIEIMMLRPSCCWTRTSVTVHSQECHRLPDLELAYRSTALGLTSNSSQPRHLWKPTSLGIWLTDTWLHRKHL